MTNNKNHNSITFLDLIKGEDKIEIPIIQRDYAQGREDKKEIRDNFLNAIFESIDNETDLKLDFIYGSKVDNVYQPLDGQQRLTTLFLLHWYSAIKENKIIEARDLLVKFSYETRITSREFCEALIKNDVLIVDNDDFQISTQIINSKWFFLSWKNDPTINSMLRTLDAIHSKFYKTENIWKKLTTDNLISFYNIDLDDIGLTDDLYIKMNARGKLLTHFENFKASFEKYIIDNKWEINLSPIDTFAFKIDTKWTDFFWANFKKNTKIDTALMRFLSTLTMYRVAIEKNSDRIQIIQSLQDNQNSIKNNYISSETYSYLCQVLEYYSKNYSGLDLSINFPLFTHKPKSNFLREVVFEDNIYSANTQSASYSQKALLFAQTEYLLKNPEFDHSKFLDWMRVIRNIVTRGSIQKGGKRQDIIRSPEAFDRVINLIVELSEGSNDIYVFLSQGNFSSAFVRDQIEEEKIKAKLIIENPDFKNEIFEMEDLSFFKGRIDFAFKCIGYKNNTSNFDKVSFVQIKKAIIDNFGNDDNLLDFSNDIRRALLTIEDHGAYNFYEYWWSRWNVNDATKRCLIENYRELEYYIYNTDKSIFINKLLNKLKVETLDQILENFTPPLNMPNWKLRLIKEKKLLDTQSKSNYIAIDEKNDICYLLRSKRPRDIEGCVEIK
ncbi:MAG: DUF262 domain-containing protein [Flavobacterium sp.]|uniref:DUF262 domain-containing protein n=1 Tax=Flavobacterium sp. TaxID=239 RepID=UPI00326314D9